MWGVHLYTLLNTKKAEFVGPFQDVYDQWTNQPSFDDALVWDTFVRTMVSNGRWARTDGVWVMATHTNDDGEALCNWRDPSGNKATLHGSPQPSFTAYQGFEGQGVFDFAYVDFNWNPVTNGVNYTLNSASLLIYARKSGARYNSNESLGGIGLGARLQIMPRSSSSYYTIYVNSGSNSVANTDTDGVFIASRTASNVQRGYRNKSLLVDGFASSASIPNGDLFGLAQNNSGSAVSHSDNEIALVVVGDGMDQDDVDSWTDNFETVMDAFGKGVI